MKYKIFIQKDEDGFFVSKCPNLFGVVSQGKTKKEALNNVKDAIKGYLESLKKE